MTISASVTWALLFLGAPFGAVGSLAVSYLGWRRWDRVAMVVGLVAACLFVVAFAVAIWGPPQPIRPLLRLR